MGIPVLTCTDDATDEGVAVKIDSYKDNFDVVSDQSKYSQNLTRFLKEEEESKYPGFEKSTSKRRDTNKLLSVNDTKQSRQRAGSFGVVAKRRSIFETEDQEKSSGVDVDPLAETIVILTNAEKREMETKAGGSDNLSVDVAPQPRRGSFSFLRSIFEA